MNLNDFFDSVDNIILTSKKPELKPVNTGTFGKVEIDGVFAEVKKESKVPEERNISDLLKQVGVTDYKLVEKDGSYSIEGERFLVTARIDETTSGEKEFVVNGTAAFPLTEPEVVEAVEKLKQFFGNHKKK